MTPPPDPATWLTGAQRAVPPPRPDQLSRERIVAAATELADAEPHGEITMRALAGRLGVRSPMALYRYVGSKDGLADLMADEVYGLITPTRGQGWREALRSLGRTGWAAVQAHPWFARLAVARPPFRPNALAMYPAAPPPPGSAGRPSPRPPFGPNALAMYDAALAELEPLDLDAGTLMGSINTVLGHVLGSGLALLEERAMRARVGVTSDDQLADAAVEPLAEIAASGRYPHFSRWAADATRDTPPPQSFEQILEWLLDGLAPLRARGDLGERAGQHGLGSRRRAAGEHHPGDALDVGQLAAVADRGGDPGRVRV